MIFLENDELLMSKTEKDYELSQVSSELLSES